MKMKLMSLVAAGLGALLAVHSASADTFSTSVAFNGGPLLPVDTDLGLSGGLQANGVLPTPVTLGFVTLAQFQELGTSFTPGPTDTFTLQLTQVPPGLPGSNYGTASVNGFFTVSDNQLYLSFTSPTSVSLDDGVNTYTYALISPSLFPIAANQISNLKANVTVQADAPVPLPLSAVGGTGLLGLLGVSQFKRRKLA